MRRSSKTTVYTISNGEFNSSTQENSRLNVVVESHVPCRLGMGCRLFQAQDHAASLPCFGVTVITCESADRQCEILVSLERARFSVRRIARHSRHAYVTWRRPLQRGVWRDPTPLATHSLLLARSVAPYPFIADLTATVARRMAWTEKVTKMSKKHLHNQAAIPLAPAVFKEYPKSYNPGEQGLSITEACSRKLRGRTVASIPLPWVWRRRSRPRRRNAELSSLFIHALNNRACAVVHEYK
ncbi:unnamed protein product [Chrysodeixis includens]|uniref:Uncharacterized protein n=1 Tax=Chrysodeixis includens TaxID=689277 RepID=A0A9N8KX47_CHRIL|nr:unnamed protein product [Chrysodeixis includens]